MSVNILIDYRKEIDKATFERNEFPGRKLS